MPDLSIATIAFNTPWLIDEQIRLFRKYIKDSYELIVFDNSGNASAATEIERICVRRKTTYFRLFAPQRFHHYALTLAERQLRAAESDYFGFVDHDIFPTKHMKLVPMIDEGGFLAMGQTHVPTGRQYPWPGFFFLRRAWLADRQLNFFGITARDPRQSGDTGSLNYFAPEEWDRMATLSHGYETIRDGTHLQSFGYERIGDWIHLTNGSNWMKVPDPAGREQLLRALVAKL